jgi:hypothetical protein
MLRTSACRKDVLEAFRVRFGWQRDHCGRHHDGSGDDISGFKFGHMFMADEYEAYDLIPIFGSYDSLLSYVANTLTFGIPSPFR